MEPNTNLGRKLKETDLIIWDEAPMQNKLVLKAIDNTLRDVRSSDKNLSEEQVNNIKSKSFGGVTLLMAGDWRQILPVVKNGIRIQIVNKTHKKCYSLWPLVNQFYLKTNMRVNGSEPDDVWFKEYLMSVGNGSANTDPNNPEMIQIPPRFIIDGHQPSDLCNSIYNNIGSFVLNSNSDDYSKWLQSRAIKCSTNSDVDLNNTMMLQRLPGEEYFLRC